MVETDIIGHLIDVEHRASSLVLDAQIEADQLEKGMVYKKDKIDA